MKEIELPPVHPGKTLAAEIAARNISASEIALKIKVPPNRISEICRGKRRVSMETALRLGRYFGNSAQFWANLQINYDLALARKKYLKIIEREVMPAE